MNGRTGVYRVAASFFALALITTMVLSVTLAKYTSEFSGYDKALAAKWDIVAADGKGNLLTSGDDPARLNLFDHVYETYINQKDGEDGDYIIAPGVEGAFILNVTNRSDVAAAAEFSFEKIDDSIDAPIEYSLDADFNPSYNDLDDLAGALNELADYKMIKEWADTTDTPVTVSKTVYWRWLYERGSGENLITNDAKDTGFGEASRDAYVADGNRVFYGIMVKIGATQLKPMRKAPDLFFSEYIEGSSNNKALEIFNGTGDTVNLSGYSIKIYSNGNTSVSTSIPLDNKDLANGGVFVVAHNEANASIKSIADQLSTHSWYNGNDAVVLMKGTTVVDCIGKIGEDPGDKKGWGSGDTTTYDHTLVRKPSVAEGDTNTEDSFDPSLEWIGYPVDTSIYLGNHDWH